MALRISKGNMYEFITHTWNTVKGACYHDCYYCYMKRWGKLNPVRFDEKELETDLGKDNFIFVGSSNDLFADNIPENWIRKTLDACYYFYENSYLFQTKNPERALNFISLFPSNSVICTTIETNRHYPDIMSNSPKPIERVNYMSLLKIYGYTTYVTIEPILDFDMLQMVEYIKMCAPSQVNIGADSIGHNLPEPPKNKIFELICELEKFTIVNQKKNLKRLLE
jgi:DNA repair photolyase